MNDNRQKVLVVGPALTLSGYGEQTRFALRALRSQEDQYDIYLNTTSWGASGWLHEDNEEREWIDKVMGTETFDDVIKVTDALFAYCKENESETDNSYDEFGDMDESDEFGEDEESEGSDGSGDDAQPVYDLMDAVDTFVPTPERAVDKAFLMPVEDVFSITGRGTVATGRIESGKIKVGEEVALVGMGSELKSVCTGVEMFRKILDEGEAGDNAGLLLRGVDKEHIERGMVLAKPGSITPHTKFKAEVYVLKKEEGGRHTPFFKGYRPQFYFRTTDVTGSCELPSGTEMVMPGDNVTLDISLITPIAMEQELRFAIREGGHTVGAGVVTEIVE